MLFTLDKGLYELARLGRKHLKDISWREEDLQKLLFKDLSMILEDADLVPISHSRKWQEEPDILAIDNNGELYIFELKRWEAEEQNLLQVLRYGQIYGQYTYDKLNDLFLKFYPKAPNLLDFLNKKFEANLTRDQINKRQHFVVMTNGLDFKTRQAIQYWRQSKIEIESWVYRVYKIRETILVEFDKFRIKDNPDEDIDEGYYILNTNYSNEPKCDKDMLDDEKAAAYMDPWKKNIEKLQKGDKVFLYRSGDGIVAMGIASGELRKGSYPGEAGPSEDQYYMKLKSFRRLSRPLSASEIKRISGRDYRFMVTMFAVDKDIGDSLWGHILKTCV